MDVKFSFEDIGKGTFGHIFRPVAKVTFKSPTAEKWVDVWMIVDTGADYTILPRHFSEKLRISLEKDCIKDVTKGVGGEQTVYLCKSKIQVKVGSLERKIPVAFLDSDEVPPLLGRLGFLETFYTQFLKTHSVVFKG
ncbi:retroviral-like aspartic protease family protein [Candidatus Daviesbacteria bacterium]|nr:retroviral-like aspartic protease family protein [Candidatus Daviesbacteria bacterium]